MSTKSGTIFQDTLNPIYSCGDDIKTAIHYLLHYPKYLYERRTLLDNARSIGENIHDKNYFQISELLHLASLQIMMQQIHVFCMLTFNTCWLLNNLVFLLVTLEFFERFTFLNTYARITPSNNSSHKI